MTEPAQRERAKEREREAAWKLKERERDVEENKRVFEYAIGRIPNPGPDDEPLVELQAFHAEQTDPPPGPYPDPPPGPYPDPVIKERPSEEVVYGRTRSERTGRKPGAAGRNGNRRSAANGPAHQSGQH